MDEVRDGEAVVSTGGKRAPVGPTQDGVRGMSAKGNKGAKQTPTATKEHGADPREAAGRHRTRNDEATKRRISHIIPTKKKTLLANMTPCTPGGGPVAPKSPDAAPTDPAAKTPTAGKQDDKTATVTPAGKQGAGSPGVGGKEGMTTEGGGTSDGGATQNKKRMAGGAGKSPNRMQQRLVNSAKKSKRAKAKAAFAANGGQDAVSSAAKKDVQLTVEQRDVHYVKVECKATASVSRKKAIKTVLGLLLAKVPGLEILHIMEKNKKIQGRGGLSANWSRDLDGYAHVKEGTAAMARVRFKHKMVSFTVIVFTPAKFDLKGHLIGVSINLVGHVLGQRPITGPFISVSPPV